MKRFWLGLAIMVLGLAAGFLVQVRLENNCRETGALVQLAARQAEEENFAGAQQSLQQAFQTWERGSLLASAFCDHRSMDQAESILAEISVYARQENELGLQAGASRLILLLKAMGASQRLDLNNLF